MIFKFEEYTAVKGKLEQEVKVALSGKGVLDVPSSSLGETGRLYQWCFRPGLSPCLLCCVADASHLV